MSTGNYDFFVDGTAALKPTAWDLPKDERQYTFDVSAKYATGHSNPVTRHFEAAAKTVGNALARTLLRSEMFCSLMLEDVRGVAYNAFTASGIAVFSVATALIAIASLIIGY